MSDEIIILGVVLGVILILIACICVFGRPPSTRHPSAVELSASVVESDVIERIYRNPSLIGTYLTYDIFVSDFRNRFRVIDANLLLERPLLTERARDLTFHMNIKRVYELAYSIFGNGDRPVESIKRWIDSGKSAVVDQGRAISVRAPLFSEPRSVDFDAELWVVEAAYSRGTASYRRAAPFSISAEAFRSRDLNLMKMGPGSFDLEFKLRYDAGKGILKVFDATVTLGKMDDFLIDLYKIPPNQRSESLDLLIKHLQPGDFAYFIHTQLQKTLQGFLAQIFSSAL